MPNTRSRVGADGGNSESAGIAQSADQSAASLIRNNSQGSDMSWTVPTDLNDQQIVLLRAAVIRARKDLDDLTAEISEQASVISTAQGKNTPAETLLSYKKA